MFLGGYWGLDRCLFWGQGGNFCTRYSSGLFSPSPGPHLLLIFDYGPPKCPGQGHPQKSWELKSKVLVGCFLLLATSWRRAVGGVGREQAQLCFAVCLPSCNSCV